MTFLIAKEGGINSFCYEKMLTDSFGRVHDYLRISLTPQCNFSCFYCRTAKDFISGGLNVMTPAEIHTIAEVFVDIGIKKIRLTGGEPLIRKEFPEILRLLSRLPVELTFTTNGFFIDRYIDLIREAGIKSVNVSLDSLRPDRFKLITQRSAFRRVHDNIRQLIEHDIHVKLNMVVVKGINEDEVFDFITLTRDLPLHVRFIEFMPFAGNHWSRPKVVPTAELLENVRSEFSVLKLEDRISDTSKKYFVAGYQGTFAFISTISEPFCAGCNRLRLTADGKLKNCLFSRTETDLLTAMREGIEIEPFIRNELLIKKEMRGGGFLSAEAKTFHHLSMIQIGG